MTVSIQKSTTQYTNVRHLTENSKRVTSLDVSHFNKLSKHTVTHGITVMQ